MKILYGGASRIHGELLMLGFEVAQSTVLRTRHSGGQFNLHYQHPPATRVESEREACDR